MQKGHRRKLKWHMQLRYHGNPPLGRTYPIEITQIDPGANAFERCLIHMSLIAHERLVTA